MGYRLFRVSFHSQQRPGKSGSVAFHQWGCVWQALDYALTETYRFPHLASADDAATRRRAKSRVLERGNVGRLLTIPCMTLVIRVYDRVYDTCDTVAYICHTPSIKMSHTKPISIRLNPEILEQIDALVAAGNETRTNVIERLLAIGLQGYSSDIAPGDSPVLQTVIHPVSQDDFSVLHAQVQELSERLKKLKTPANQNA